MIWTKIRAGILFVLALAVAVPSAMALNAKLELVASGLTHPLQLIESPDGTKRRFIVEQLGTIRILTPDGKLLPEPFLNVRHKLPPLLQDFDEEGLLSLAFHPDYKSNGRFFVTYTMILRGDATLDKQLWYAHTNVVAEYKVSASDPNKADPLSEKIISQIDWPQFNHNGHWIGFGPDGYLYISTGDGGYANDWGIGHNPEIGNGQDLTVLLAKMLRVDVNNVPKGASYGIPSDNPWAKDPNVRPEIWAYGFRNPWRCSFDMGGTKELFCGDVQQNSYEEVDIVVKGGNFGWRAKEATHCFDFLKPNSHPKSCNDDGMIDPIIEYNNCNVHKDCKGLSVTGGHVYRGAHKPWQGLYIFGDWSKTFATRDGRLYAAKKSGDKWSMEDIEVPGGFNSYVLGFGQDLSGEVYVMATDVTGPVGAQDRIFKLVP